DDVPAVRHRRVGDRLLQGSDVDLPLADAGVDGVRARAAALGRDGRRVRDDAGDLASQIEPGGLPVAEPTGHLRDGVETDAVADRVVVDVAGLRERVLHVQQTVTLRLVAAPAVVAHGVAAAAEHGAARRDRAALQAGEGNDGLERRPRV